MSFDHSRSAMVMFSLYDYSASQPHPRDIYRNVTPVPVRIKWLPQTLYDCICVYYEFATTADRDAFLANPPELMAKADPCIPDAEHLARWTNSPDER